MAETGPDEERLIREAKTGSVPAFESLYRMHSARVYGLCMRLANNQAEAQDCTQDTFIKAWQRLADFRGESMLGTWLHRIAVNEVIGRRRKDAVQKRHLSAVVTHDDPVATDSGALDDLEEAIVRLPERVRQVLVLHKIYGYTHEQTAGMLDIAVGTSKAHIHKAVKLLAETFPEQSHRAKRTLHSAAGSDPQ